jgi:hypothetical protein
MSLDVPVAAINTPQLLVRQLLAKEHATVVTSHLLHLFSNGIAIRFQANPNSADHSYPSSIPSTELALRADQCSDLVFLANFFGTEDETELHFFNARLYTSQDVRRLGNHIVPL